MLVADALAEPSTLGGERRRALGPELGEEPVVLRELARPACLVDAHHLREALGREVEPGPVEVAVRGLESERSLDRVTAAAAALDDPLQHPHVLAEAWPRKATVLVGPEPVHVED